MKNTIKMFGIIAIVAVIGFAMAGCATGGGSSGGGTSAADEAKLAAVAPGDVPANLVGRWFSDERKRRGDFYFEITADGKVITEDDAFTIHADGTHLWMPHPTMGEVAFPSFSESGRTPYKLVGNTLNLTMNVMGHTMEMELFR